MKPIKQEYLDEAYMYVSKNIEDAIKVTLTKAWYDIKKHKIQVTSEKDEYFEKILNKIKSEWYLEWKFNI